MHLKEMRGEDANAQEDGNKTENRTIFATFLNSFASCFSLSRRRGACFG